MIESNRFSADGGKGANADKMRKRIDLKKEILGVESKKQEGDSSKKASAAGPEGFGWIRACTLEELRAKNGKFPVVMSGTNGFLVVQTPDQKNIFATDVFSTAYKYPLVDGVVSERVNEFGIKRWAIETPLDGTSYSLESGAVIEWCPKNNPARALLGMLKKDIIPIPLLTHQVQVVGDIVYVKLNTPAPATA